MEPKYCPLIKDSCLDERCGWWSSDTRQCAVAGAVEILREIEQKLPDISN